MREIELIPSLEVNRFHIELPALMGVGNVCLIAQHSRDGKTPWK